MDQTKLQEELLYAWMQMSVCIRGNRILSALSFNEMMLCGMMHRRQSAGLSPLTATELGERMKLLKSQINHLLTGMEKNGVISRIRSTEDKRVIHVYLTDTGRELYEQEHARVMEIMSLIQRDLGNDDTRRLTELIVRATELVASHTER